MGLKKAWNAITENALAITSTQELPMRYALARLTEKRTIVAAHFM